MANTGYFCILVNEDYRRGGEGVSPSDSIIDRLRKYVSTHFALKNLVIEFHRTGSCGVIMGNCDRLYDGDLLEFFGGEMPPGIRAFVADCGCGDVWGEETDEAGV